MGISAAKSAGGTAGYPRTVNSEWQAHTGDRNGLNLQRLRGQAGGSFPPAANPTAGGIHILADTDIGGGWRMSNNQSVSSLDGRTQLKLLRGLLEVWRDGSHVWTAGQSAGGDYVDFQHDGNLVVYTNAGRAVWASNTSFWCGPDGCR